MSRQAAGREASPILSLQSSEQSWSGGKELQNISSDLPHEVTTDDDATFSVQFEVGDYGQDDLRVRFEHF